MGECLSGLTFPLQSHFSFRVLGASLRRSRKWDHECSIIVNPGAGSGPNAGIETASGSAPKGRRAGATQRLTINSAGRPGYLNERGPPSNFHSGGQLRTLNRFQ